MRRRGRELLTGDIEWARHYLAPWLGRGRGIRRLRTGYGIERKRPIPASRPSREAPRPTCARALEKSGSPTYPPWAIPGGIAKERRTGVLDVVCSRHHRVRVSSGSE